MKNIKSILIKILAFAVLFGTNLSCSDFLDEELTTQRTTDYFTTEEGIEELAVGMYNNLRFHFASEWGFATTNYGTDEFRNGGDGSNAMWNSYDGRFNSLIPAVNVNTVMAHTLWDNMFIGINTANLLLQNSETYIEDESARDLYMGEAYFLRAFNYLKLVRQYGGVPLKLVPNVNVEREFTRSTAKEVVEQVILDFENAYKLLPPTAAPGKFTKDAAAHFLAKAYLFRASEINDSWNSDTKESDLEKGLMYAEEVISHRELAPNFADLWNYTEVNGPNENLEEIILAAQFTSDVSTVGRYGNQMHLFYLSVYRDLPNMTRDIAGGREYQRLRTNYYAYNVYDRVNDSRFWKSFKTKYAVNNPAKDSEYEHGDLGVMYIINHPDDTRFAAQGSLNSVNDPKTGKEIPSVFAIYAEGTEYLNSDAFSSKFAPLNKYLDGSRESLGKTEGYRDGILARLADTYLTAAEIAIRQEDYPKALNYINIVRQRAAYNEGEDRKAYTDGGAAYKGDGMNSFYAENSYYESNNIPETTEATDLTITSFSDLPEEDEAIIQQLNITGAYDRALAFLLNERSRELMGEFYRWEDLSRTKTLVSRVKSFNPQAAPNVKETHLLRPIPQSHLDVVQRDGSALTPAQKAEEQNPGY